MVDQPLVNANELEGFPGAPFAPNVLLSAAGQVRDQCGWHIAPTVTETDVLIRGGGTVALLPSLYVTAVSAVTRMDGTALEGWSFHSNGVLSRTTAFPEQFKVTFTHGYTSCPPSLLSAVAERARSIRGGGRVKQESLAGRSVSLETATGDAAADVALSKYTLPGRP